MTPTVLLLLVALALGTRAFNLEPRLSRVIFDPSGDFDSYFGYALGFWKHTREGRTTTWLLVGAPKGQVKDLTGDRVKRPGAVYKCQIDSQNSSSCTMVPVLGSDEKVEQDLRWRRKVKNIPARAWIGSTIAVENKPNGGVVVCGPRMKRWMNIFLRYIPGTCFYWQDDASVSVLPLIDSAYPNVESGFETGFAQVGMSADFLKDSNDTQLVLGAPGIFYFQGAMAVYEKDPTKPKQKGLPRVRMPSATHVTYDSYMGYSVTTAKLHKDGPVSYIAGAPRATGNEFYTGAVYLVQQPHASKWRAVTTLKGHQMGEYFGATVAALDLDLDGLDDLLVVGAPLHCPRSKSEVASASDLGVVYVYLNKGEAQLELLEAKLTGSSVTGARFGSSLAVVGDVNKDGYADLAVGAPYEGSGAVYIYHGQDGGLRSRYSQRIAASDIDASLKGFGISISAGMDVDDNTFIDIAVGSHESSRVVVIKSYPVIDFDATLEPRVKRLDISADKFSVKACLRYTTKADPLLIQDMEAEMTLRVDPTLRRAVLTSPQQPSERPSFTRQVRLQRGVTFCWELDVVLKGNLFQVTQPIELSLDYKVLDDPSTDRDKEFCKLCPMADPLKPSSIHTKVPFAHGCKSKTVCQSDLKVEVVSSSKGEHMVLGEDNRLTLQVSVTNSGEPAYLSKLAVVLPGKDMLFNVPSVCYQDEAGDSKSQQETFKCNLGNPLGNKVGKVSIFFEVDLSGIHMYTSFLTFNFTAWSASEELTPQDNTYIVTIPIALVSRLVIHGKTNHRKIIFSSKDSVAPNIVPVLHKYEVVNYGPSPVGEVLVQFEVPIAYIQEAESKTNVFLTFPDPQITIDGRNSWCEVDYDSLNDSTITAQFKTRWLEKSLQPEVVPHPVASAEGGQRKRRRRSLEELADNTTEVEKDHVKRALHLNCTVEAGVVCVPVTCVGGPLIPHSRAEVNFQLYFQRPVIESLLNSVDAVQFQTTGEVNIVEHKKYTVTSEHRDKGVSVETMFMGDLTGDDVAPWILPLSIALGLMTFLLLVKGLSNVGFFKRGHREKLELMKEKAAAEEEFKTNVDNQEDLEDHYNYRTRR